MAGAAVRAVAVQKPKCARKTCARRRRASWSGS